MFPLVSRRSASMFSLVSRRSVSTSFFTSAVSFFTSFYIQPGGQAVVDQLCLAFDQCLGLLLIHARLGKVPVERLFCRFE